MKLYSEESLLDIGVRKKIIQEINDTNNQMRKNEAKKRHEVYKDNTIKYVMKKLQNEGLKPETLQLMQNRASNISIAKKMINKLAKAYQAGVTRETGQDELNKSISYLAMLLDFDSKQKKADRYLRLQKNCLPWFIPEKVYSDVESSEKYIIKMKVFSPWQYDAVDNIKDPDCPIAIVLSDHYDAAQESVIKGGRNQVSYLDSHGTEWKRDNTIADGPNVSKANVKADVYIFWSNKYHFTCNENGAILKDMSPDDLLNPIEVLPGVPLAKDRDDSFWAGGGEDLVDGAILVNTMFTDLNAIMFMQGWGQMVIIGEKGQVPKEMTSGPHHAMVLTYNSKKGEKAPTIDVINSNPPIDSWMKCIEQFLAMLLSTNNLSPTSVSGKLDAVNFPSGVAMLIEKSESTEDVTDQQQEFQKAERKEWRIYAKWHNYFLSKQALEEEYAVVGQLPDDLDVLVKFGRDANIMTEAEKLANLKLKKELGLITQVEMLMIDNPGMTEEEAEKKLLKIKEEKAEDAVREASQVADDMVPPAENDPAE